MPYGFYAEMRFADDVVYLGCCLDAEEEDYDDFVVPFRNRGWSKGGAPAYLPPEITNAKPGKGVELNYSKSDVFACGE